MKDIIYKHFLKYRKVSTDSRNIGKNSIFFALNGENFDGNKYALNAIENGASYAIIDESNYAIDERFILVEDSLIELQDLAQKYRNSLEIPIIAITGTNGKTTTKELVNSVLKQKFKTYATKGNLNNHIGVPLSVLSITDKTEIAIIEMGANHIGEIAKLCQIAQPNYGLITNIGKAHLEGFGSFQGVIKAKTELYNYLRENSGYVFVNNNDELLSDLSKNLQSIKYSGSQDDNNKILIKKQYPSLILEWSIGDKTFPIHTNLFGDYNISNVQAAVAVGSYFKVEYEKIVNGIQNYIPENLRSQILEKGSNTIILDAYNANPSSMFLAIQNFTKFEKVNKILILGDMLELGDQSIKEHINILDFLDKNAFEKIVLVGEIFHDIANHSDTISFSSTDEAKEYFQKKPIKNSTVLLKGSRKIKLESLVEVL